MSATGAAHGVELIDLARRKDDESRQELFDTIADLFLADETRLSDRERALITGILRKLVAGVEMEVRRALAERLQGREDAPRELVVLLANDQIEIARPILLHSPVLRSEDLIQVIRLRSREHWLAIATRPRLPSEVGDALVATGDGDAIEGLLRNADAQLSRQAMAYVVAESERTDRFHLPLIRRPDLPADLALKLYWWVSAALRQYIMKHFRLAESLVDDLVEASALSVARKPATADPGIDGVAHELVARLSEAARLTPQMVINFLRSGRIPAFIAGLAQLTGVPDGLARRIALSADGESLAVICRAADVPRSDFATLFLLLQHVRDGGRPHATRTLQATLDFFDGIRIADARAAARHWARQSDYLAAIEQITLADAAAGPAPMEGAVR